MTDFNGPPANQSKNKAINPYGLFTEFLKDSSNPIPNANFLGLVALTRRDPSKAKLVMEIAVKDTLYFLFKKEFGDDYENVLTKEGCSRIEFALSRFMQNPKDSIKELEVILAIERAVHSIQKSKEGGHHELFAMSEQELSAATLTATLRSVNDFCFMRDRKIALCLACLASGTDPTKLDNEVAKEVEALLRISPSVRLETSTPLIDPDLVNKAVGHMFGEILF